MSYFVYKSVGAHDYIARADLGHSFVDVGDETPGETWVRQGPSYASFDQACTEADRLNAEDDTNA